MSIAQLEIRSVYRDCAFFSEQSYDDFQTLDHAIALSSRLDPEHGSVTRQCARTASQHRSPMRELVEKRVPIRDVKGMMVWDADNSRTEHDSLVAGGGHRCKNLSRWNNLPACRVMLTDKSFVVAELIEQLDQL